MRNTLELLTECTETLLVKTFGSKAGIPQACDVINIALKARSGDDVVIPLLTVPTICEPLSGQPITLASQWYSYRSKLELADPSECGDCLDVGILIGADHYWALVTGRTRQGIGPTAIETRLGWVLSGPITGLCSESSSVNALSCHVLKVEASQHGYSNASLDQALRKFWNLETLGINPEESFVHAYDHVPEWKVLCQSSMEELSPSITRQLQLVSEEAVQAHHTTTTNPSNMTRSSKTKSIKEL